MQVQQTDVVQNKFCRILLKKLKSYAIMELYHNTIIIIWLLFLVFIFHPPGYIAVSQSFSGNCLNMKSIVNCSHRGIVYNQADHSNDTSSFTCSVCCDRWSCCEISKNISLKIIRYSTLTFYNTCGMYFITLNISDSIHCKSSNIISNFTRDSFNGLDGTDGTSETSAEFYGTDSSRYDNSVSKWNPEFDNFISTDVNGSTQCDNSTASHGIKLDAFSGFNGSHNYLTECPCLDEWSSLEWIDLSNNHISFIMRSFGNIPLLQTLFLKNNDISLILPYVMNSMPSLKYLHLNDNPTIIDWIFLDESTNLNIVDIRGSCNRVFLYVSIACSGNNVTLITNNTSCIQDVTNCTFLPTWPTIPGTVLSVVPCLENYANQSYTTIPGTDSSTTQGVDDNEIVNRNTFCASLNWNLPFLASDNNCIWVPLSGVAALVCVGVVVVALFKWRMRVKRQGTYTGWLHVYLGTSSDKCTRQPPSVELPAVPAAINISECSSEADIYSECFYTINENAVSGKIFSERDVCMMVNFKTGTLYSRWMGTIALSNEHSKCVLFSTITGVTSQKNTVHWDEFIKRALEIPKNTHLTDIEGMSIHQRTIYLVQEYLNCETLGARLKTGTESSKTSIPLKMMTSEVMRHILGILEGLELIQSYGFLHPGFSPKKVLITNEGICKLYDFCLDKDAGNIVQMKKSQMTCGINQFAPEALLRNEYTKASDVWSTAVLFWEILSDSTPFPFDAQTISEEGLFPDPPSAWPNQYEALSNNKLYVCWRVESLLRPTISELRSSFTEISEVLITESSDIVSEDSKDGYIPMHKIGDGEKPEVAMAQ